MPGNIDVLADLPKGRISNEDALSYITQATGWDDEQTKQNIPELDRAELAFGLHDAASRYNDSEVGRYNAKVCAGWLVVHIPELNVAGDEHNDVSGINRSYAINLEDGQCIAGAGFYDAEETMHQQVGTKTTADF